MAAEGDADAASVGDGDATEVAGGSNPLDPTGDADGTAACRGAVTATSATSATTTTPPSTSHRRVDIRDECTGVRHGGRSRMMAPC